MDRTILINRKRTVPFDTPHVQLPAEPPKAAPVTRVRRRPDLHRSEVTGLAFAAVLLFVAPLLGVLPDVRLWLVAWALGVIELMCARRLARKGRA